MEMIYMRCVSCGLDYIYAHLAEGYSWKECECGSTRFTGGHGRDPRGLRDSSDDEVIGPIGILTIGICKICKHEFEYIYKGGRKRHICPSCGGIQDE